MVILSFIRTFLLAILLASPALASDYVPPKGDGWERVSPDEAGFATYLSPYRPLFFIPESADKSK